jgi:hypothetical protein
MPRPSVRFAFAPSFLAVLVPLATLPVPERGTEKKLLAVEDLYHFDAPHALALSPDGTQAMYVRQWIDAGDKADVPLNRFDRSS